MAAPPSHPRRRGANHNDIKQPNPRDTKQRKNGRVPPKRDRSLFSWEPHTETKSTGPQYFHSIRKPHTEPDKGSICLRSHCSGEAGNERGLNDFSLERFLWIKMSEVVNIDQSHIGSLLTSPKVVRDDLQGKCAQGRFQSTKLLLIVAHRVFWQSSALTSSVSSQKSEKTLL